MENIMPATVTLLLILIFALLVGRKVYGQNLEEAEKLQREAVESTYIAEIKELLTDKGFSNCGVNMTKATNKVGNWEYTVTVYHHSFEWMDNDDKANLENRMEDMGNDALGKISLTLLAR